MSHAHRYRLADAGQAPQAATPGTCVSCGATRVFNGGVADGAGKLPWNGTDEERNRRRALSEKRSAMVRKSWEKRRAS